MSLTEASLSRTSTRSYSTCPPSPTLSDSNNSLIFERNVEDPGLLTSGSPTNALSKHGSSASLLSRQYSNQLPGLHSRASSTTLPHSPPLEGFSSEYVMPSLDHRRTLENFVAPALDAGCSIVTDENADLDDMDIIYMRRPSTIGLDMALGRTKSNSSATITSTNNNINSVSGNSPTSPSIPPLSLSRSYSNSHSAQQENPRTLRFYSYADMLSDEMAHNPQTGMRKPQLSHSFSSSHIKQGQQRPAVTTNFSNPFIKRRDSNSCGNPGCNLTRRYSNTLLTRSPTTPASSYPRPQQARSRSSANVSGMSVSKAQGKALPRSGRSNFHIESSGSDELSTDDDEEMPHHSSLPPPATQPTSLLGPRISRTSTQNSTNNSAGTSPLFAARTYSNTGPPATLGGPSVIRRRESAGMFPQPSINNVLMYDDTLQTEKVGEALKRRLSHRKDSVSTNI